MNLPTDCKYPKTCPHCLELYDPRGPHLEVCDKKSRPDFQAYVVGFMFNAAHTQVALIRKTKPAWQASKLNGIGGKIEPNEDSEDAMRREFHEETGRMHYGWTSFHSMSAPTWRVDCFFCEGNLNALTSPTEERVEIWNIHDLSETATLENIPWLVRLALDSLEDGRPSFSRSYYPS
jgi:8-oxo-dGTP diphosphatase